MTIPRFTAEASLGPARGQYRVNRGMESSRGLGVTPMQQVTNASLFSGIHSWKRVPCCVDYFGKPMCTYYWVPAWFTCVPLTLGGPTCFVCYPLIEPFGNFTS
jgi:hypothetical protein